MKSLYKIVALFTVVVLGLFFFAGFIGQVNTVQAQEDGNYKFLAPIGAFGDSIDVSSKNSFPEYIKTAINLVIGFAIMAAIVLIVAAGFQYMTSTSQGSTSQAKQTISNAVLGLVLALSAVLILNTINPDLVIIDSIETVTSSGSSLEEEAKDPNNFRSTGTITNSSGGVVSTKVYGVGQSAQAARNTCQINGRVLAPAECRDGSPADFGFRDFDPNKCSINCSLGTPID